MRYLIIAITALVALGSCSKEESTAAEPSGAVEVKFANAQITTRTTGDKWDNNDEIGITMLGLAYNDDDRRNVRYTTNTDGEFSVYSDVTPIYYPQSESDEVKFYAYYPYTAENLDEESLQITIDVTKQNDEDEDQGSVDFMVAQTDYCTKTTEVKELTFSHCLSMVVLKLTHNNEISSFDGMTTTIKDVNTVAKYDAKTGSMMYSASVTLGDVTFVMETIDDVMTASAILLPGSITDGTVINFTQGDKTYPLTLSGVSLSLGYKYIYNVVVGRDTVLLTGDSEIKNWNEEDSDSLYSKE